WRGAGRGGEVLQRAEVDDDPAVVGAEPGRAVPAAAYRQVQPLLAGHADGGGHVGRSRAAHDGSRPLVDHAVVDLAGLVVGPVLGRDDLALDLVAERVDRRT